MSNDFGESSIQGIGIGLRSPHYGYIETHLPQVSWFEVLTDNYLGQGGSPLYHLKKIREHYPMVMHGVGMSLGSCDEINWDYMKKVKALVNEINPAQISDHLCWISTNSQYLHELLPLPYTEEAVNHVASRILKIQDYLNRQILIENVSSYLTYKHSQMSEWDFINAVADKADCKILLDINNIYVSATNHDFDAKTYIQAISTSRVAQFHLAGFQDCGEYLLDNHGASVCDPVWELYRSALERFTETPTLIEWDNDIPSFEKLQEQALFAEKIFKGQRYAA